MVRHQRRNTVETTDSLMSSFIQFSQYSILQKKKGRRNSVDKGKRQGKVRSHKVYNYSGHIKPWFIITLKLGESHRVRPGTRHFAV